MFNKFKQSRFSYENLFKQIYFALNNQSYTKKFSMSDYSLLKSINDMLVKANCTPLTQDELELNLI